jgi:hypothetical protein
MADTPRRRKNLFLDPEVDRRLEEFAARTHRTLTASANMLLTEALDAVDEANATDRRVQS